jgi:hypothetical protein
VKTLKFRSVLVPLARSGEKRNTWRLWDDKNLTVGDEVECVEFETGQVFAHAVITAVVEKPFGALSEPLFFKTALDRSIIQEDQAAASDECGMSV